MDISNEDYTLLAIVPGAVYVVEDWGVIETQLVLDVFVAGPSVWGDWYLADLTACAHKAAKWAIAAGVLSLPGSWLSISVDKHPNVTLRLEAIPNETLAAYAGMTRH